MRKIRLFFLSLFCFILNILIAEVNYVTTCYIYGQFGAQLFSVAMIYGLAWDNGLYPFISKEAFLTAPGGAYNYDRFFYKLCEIKPENISKEQCKHIQYEALTPWEYSGGNICLCGLRTELWYFEQYQQKIRNLFSPTNEILDYLNRKYSFILEHPKTVAVHIRTYHPYWCPDHIFLGERYYKNAMDQFSDDHLFVIFSDRIDWCKSYLNAYKKNMIFIEGNDYINDFFLMTRCKNIITANSTFSWWAAFLLVNEKGRILVPSRWFSDSYNQPINDILIRKLYPDTWEIFAVTHWQSNNTELLNYPTTSIDENK